METEQMAEVYGALGTRPSDRDSKAARKQAKADRKRADHEEAQRRTRSFTPAQRLMRDEMYPPSAALAAVNPPSREHDRSIVTGGRIIDEAIGMPASTGDVADMAVDIINQLGTGLHTGLKEWAIIQRMIEAGIRAGYKLGSADTAADLMGG